MRVVTVVVFAASVSGCGMPSAESVDAQSRFFVDADHHHALTVRYGSQTRPVLYFPGESKSSPTLNVFVLAPSGTYTYDPKRRRFTYHLTYQQLPNAKAVDDYATLWQKSWDADNFIFLSLPGTFGSGNATYEHATPQAVDALDDAVTQLKARYGAKMINIGGQSASGGIVAGLLSRRNDISLLVLGATLFNPDDYKRKKGWPSDYTGIAVQYSPVLDIANIKGSPTRKILVISDPDDKVVPYRYSQEYVDAVRRQGHDVALETVHIDTAKHHELTVWAITRLLQNSHTP